VAGAQAILDPFQFVFSVLQPPTEYHERIITKWQSAGCPPLPDHAPYTAYALGVHFLSHIALAHKLISTRPSNSLDMAYLLYLPFCNVFVSSDKLHQRVSPLLMRTDQTFVWGPDLKADLAKLNVHYKGLSESIKEQGIITFAHSPPTEGDFLVSALWDRFLPGWRKWSTSGKAPDVSDIQDVLDTIKKGSASRKSAPEGDVGPTDYRVLSVQRRVRRKRGSWYQVPKDVKDDD
jgi:hypothetical protein